MMIAAALAFSLFGPPPLRAGGWTLQVSKDRFDGAVTCVAKKRGVTLRGNLAVFALGSEFDTRDAEYRIDAGAAHSVHELALRLAVAGAPRTLEPIDNPSRGLVVLPVEALSASRYVDIRPDVKQASHHFDTSGIGALQALAQSKGCP